MLRLENREIRLKTWGLDIATHENCRNISSAKKVKPMTSPNRSCDLDAKILCIVEGWTLLGYSAL
jgi:hypothetical protein